MKKILSELDDVKTLIITNAYTQTTAIKLIDHLNRIMSQIRMIEK